MRTDVARSPIGTRDIPLCLPGARGQVSGKTRSRAWTKSRAGPPKTMTSPRQAPQQATPAASCGVSTGLWKQAGSRQNHDAWQALDPPAFGIQEEEWRRSPRGLPCIRNPASL